MEAPVASCSYPGSSWEVDPIGERPDGIIASEAGQHVDDSILDNGSSQRAIRKFPDWDSASYRKLHADEIARLEPVQDSFDQTKFSCPPSHTRHGLQAILDEGRLTLRRVAIVV